MFKVGKKLNVACLTCQELGSNPQQLKIVCFTFFRGDVVLKRFQQLSPLLLITGEQFTVTGKRICTNTGKPHLEPHHLQGVQSRMALVVKSLKLCFLFVVVICDLAQEVEAIFYLP